MQAKIKKIPDFRKTKILVVGDVMLDRYITGDVERISPEAPVPIVHVHNCFDLPGGAGNVALNLRSLGANVTLIGLVGKDKNAARLKKELGKNKVEGILFETGGLTVSKVRVTSRSQQLIRLDYEEKFDLADKEEKKFLKTIEHVIGYHHLVILSDYAKGTLSAKICKEIIRSARSHGIPVIVDPKSRDWSRYSGAYMITPNFNEFREVIEKSVPNTNESIAKEGKALLKKSGISYLVVTRSEKGMSLIKPSGADHWNAGAKEVFDVSGAGDTVIATLGASLGCGESVENAAYFANIAAGIAVGKAGTATVTAEELKGAL